MRFVTLSLNIFDYQDTCLNITDCLGACAWAHSLGCGHARGGHVRGHAREHNRLSGGMRVGTFARVWACA